MAHFSGLAKAYSRMFSTFKRDEPSVRSYRFDNSSSKDQNGFPLPPPEFMQYGESAARHALTGKRDANLIAEYLSSMSDQKGAILDFGCSNGRVTRWLHRFAETREVWGVDVNGAAVTWAAMHLYPIQFCTTSTYGSLPFCDGFFSFAFCYSVFTHLDEAFTYWLQELRRVIRPGGRLVITLHDEVAIEVVRTLVQNKRIVFGDIEDPRFIFNDEEAVFGVHVNNDLGFNTYLREDFFLKIIRKSFQVIAIREKTMGGFQTAYILERLPHHR